MTDDAQLARDFEGHRVRLRAIAARMLGSYSEADDAVQQSWLRLSRADSEAIENLGAWLTTVVSRVCLNILRTRQARHEDLAGQVPDPVIATLEDPQAAAELADEVGRALIVVLDTLPPGERVAFVLHDLFAVPFGEIAELLGRSPASARQLASRGRRRVRGGTPEADHPRKREVFEAFLAAGREGDFAGLLAVLHPDVVLRADFGTGAVRTVQGADDVAAQAALYGQDADVRQRLALVNGSPGAIAFRNGRPSSVFGLRFAQGRIVAIDILADPERIAALDLSALQ